MAWRARLGRCIRRRTATRYSQSPQARTISAWIRSPWVNSARRLRIAWLAPWRAVSTTPRHWAQRVAGGTYSAADRLRPTAEDSQVNAFSRRHFLGAAGGLATATAFGPEVWAQAKDKLVIGMSLEPPVLDPTKNAAAAIREVTSPGIFESLGRIDRTGAIAPGVAQSWSISEDGKEYVFKLRSGVKFHDGEPL